VGDKKYRLDDELDARGHDHSGLSIVEAMGRPLSIFDRAGAKKPQAEALGPVSGPRAGMGPSLDLFTIAYIFNKPLHKIHIHQ